MVFRVSKYFGILRTISRPPQFEATMTDILLTLICVSPSKIREGATPRDLLENLQYEGTMLTNPSWHEYKCDH